MHLLERALICLILLCTPLGVLAGGGPGTMIVNDPWDIGQNTETAISTGDIDYQAIQQTQSQLQMIANEATNLKNYPDGL